MGFRSVVHSTDLSLRLWQIFDKEVGPGEREPHSLWWLREAAGWSAEEFAQACRESEKDWLELLPAPLDWEDDQRAESGVEVDGEVYHLAGEKR